MKILMVDDNAQVRLMIRSLLMDMTDEIRECDDGSKALAAYREFRPDWVLMDLKMAHADGIETTRRVKSEFPEAKIVIVTNYDDGDLREAARAAGAFDYVVKDDLLKLLRVIAPES